METSSFQIDNETKHYGTASREVQELFKEHLKEKYRCISIDLPGHGDSSNLENIGSNEVISSISLAISELLSNLNISSYTYIGLSIGGMLAIPLYRIDKKKIKKW